MLLIMLLALPSSYVLLTVKLQIFLNIGFFLINWISVLSVRTDFRRVRKISKSDY